MPRRSVVETHPEYEKIRQDIVQGVMTYTKIAKKYGISYDAVRRFVDKQLVHLAAESQKVREWDADRIVEELEEIMSYAQKLLDACDEWLRDPESPDRYTLMPRSDEVDVVYMETSGDRTVPKKAKLQDLLDGLKEDGYAIRSATWKVSDPRKLMLDAVSRLGSQMEIIAKTRGEIKDVTYSIANSEVWINFQQIILQQLRDYPEARQQLAAGLRTLSSPDKPPGGSTEST